jgi:hypothetical protein
VLILFALPRDSRYLMWLSPALCLLFALALDDLARRAAPQATAWTRRAAIALTVGALLGGPLYAAYRWRLVGPPPASASAVEEFLERRLPLYRSLLALREQPDGDANVYAFRGERLHYFAGSRLLGDVSGPHRYDLILPLLDRPRSLAQRLRGFGAHWLLLPLDGIAPSSVEGLRASPDFKLVYQDREAMVFAIVGRV